MTYYQLVALDIDGTLVSEDLHIPERTAKAIRQSIDSGVHVTLASGRMFASARQFAAQLDIRTPLICYQGAMIADPVSGSLLHHRGIPVEDAFSVVTTMRQRGKHVNVYLDDTLYVDEVTPEAALYARMARVEAHPVGDVIPLLEAAALRDTTTTKLVVIADETATLIVSAELQEQYSSRLNVVRSFRLFTEITALGVSKGPSLAWLAERLNVPQHRVLAIGDNDNDADMLAWAGMGVAMGQATPAARQAARAITGTIHDSGAAAAIEQYVLNDTAHSLKME